MKKHLFILSFITGLSSMNCLAQISSPGLGVAHTANWFAFGIRQELDTIKEWESTSYIGIGRKSNPDNYDLLFKPAIFVINQEFYHQFHKHWQYSFALSYRRENEYIDTPPYEHDNPNIRQEFRLYGRLSYILKTSHIKLAPTIRQEFRKFYTPGFKKPTEEFQLRTRVRLKLSINLNAKKTHRLIVSSEQLFSVSKETMSNSWTDYNYQESRFCLYYSLSPETLPFIFDIGYMNNLIGRKTLYDVHYLVFDIILENPFKFRKRKKENIIENLE